jgi:hypothetical protein
MGWNRKLWTKDRPTVINQDYDHVARQWYPLLSILRVGLLHSPRSPRRWETNRNRLRQTLRLDCSRLWDARNACRQSHSQPIEPRWTTVFERGSQTGQRSPVVASRPRFVLRLAVWTLRLRVRSWNMGVSVTHQKMIRYFQILNQMILLVTWFCISLQTQPDHCSQLRSLAIMLCSKGYPALVRRRRTLIINADETVISY